MNKYLQTEILSRCCSCQVLNFHPLSSWCSRPQQQERRAVIGLNSFLGYFCTASGEPVFKRGEAVARGSSLEELCRITCWTSKESAAWDTSLQVCRNYYTKSSQSGNWRILLSKFFCLLKFIPNRSYVVKIEGNFVFKNYWALVWRNPVAIAAQPETYWGGDPYHCWVNVK